MSTSSASSNLGSTGGAGKAAGDDEPADWAEAAEARVLGEALALAPQLGWTWRMAYAAGKAAGLSRGDVELLLPRGPADLAVLWSRDCDAAAIAALGGVDPAALKVRERIRRGTLARIQAAMRSEAATRRWSGFLALHARLGLKLAWESADAVWRWAGDTSTDANHYSKRALLAEILVGALLVRLRRGEAAAEAHVDRRIEAVMAFERLKARAGKLEFGRVAAETLGRIRHGGIGP